MWFPWSLYKSFTSCCYLEWCYTKCHSGLLLVIVNCLFLVHDDLSTEIESKYLETFIAIWYWFNNLKWDQWACLIEQVIVQLVGCQSHKWRKLCARNILQHWCFKVSLPYVKKKKVKIIQYQNYFIEREFNYKV